MSLKRTTLLFAALLLAGAGCLSSPAPQIPEDATPHVNESNCTRSGGSVDGDFCACPDGFDMDPAGFCLDAQGHAGGEMAPTP